MSRGFAIIVSTLGAFAAQAEEIKSAESAEAQSAAVAQAQKKTEPPVVLASRTVPATSSGNATANTRDEADAVPRKSTATELATRDCSAVATYLAGGTLAVRTYDAPPGTRPGWRQAPYVASVTRCDRLYILLVKSRSREAWVIRQARLEAPGGVVLQVENVQPAKGPDGRDLNVIVARAPEGKKAPKLKLDLAGEDGRVAQAEAGDIP